MRRVNGIVRRAHGSEDRMNDTFRRVKRSPSR
jgi:hypothetical protein